MPDLLCFNVAAVFLALVLCRGFVLWREGIRWTWYSERAAVGGCSCFRFSVVTGGGGAVVLAGVGLERDGGLL